MSSERWAGSDLLVLRRSRSVFLLSINICAVAHLCMFDVMQSCTEFRAPRDPISHCDPQWEVRCPHSHHRPPLSERRGPPPPSAGEAAASVLCTSLCSCSVSIYIHRWKRQLAALDETSLFWDATPPSLCMPHTVASATKKKNRMLALNLPGWILILPYSNDSEIQLHFNQLSQDNAKNSHCGFQIRVRCRPPVWGSVWCHISASSCSLELKC